MTHYGLVINGKKLQTAQYAEVRNPADGAVVGMMPLATQMYLDKAVAAAATAFPAWAATPDAERQALCHKVADIIETHTEELAELLTLEQGKPLNGLGSRFEIGGAVAWARATADLTLSVEILQDTPEGRVELHRKPIGVVGSITPWNWPVMIACWHVLPAIRAGNTVVNKPSSLTPLSTIRMVELMNEVLPPGVINVVTGEGGLGGQLSSHPGISKVVFTGSTPVGKKVMEAASGTLKRLTLELGGNDAGIVLPDADPQAIAEGLFWGAFINNGQTCAALKRLYVHDSIHDAVCDALTAYASQVKVGDGLLEDSILGPVQNEKQLALVRELVEDAKLHGGKVLLGGNPGNGPGFFYPVTLVSNVDNGIRLVDEEQFGPALPIIRYGTVEEAVAKANDCPFGLGGSVWSKDIEAAKAVATRLECGSVWINKHGAVQPNAPFGGVKQSGMGVEFGVEGLKEFTTIQTLLV
ncbi:aldehyde dehydrogenase family protein [Acidocella aminolytica]|jgi:acyl-CoA reductase-like NAD-dependent aldehyde dehydrogenase|uniref:Aldehyde dehydrogenase n=1 Tax=Acidocella aminolytica 101 = DSM 11237 TaxID=1120923 RepID=A0A0D6PJB4_9PROT|nr:aldehyde dehydrogenase family protein [Acidocella aminolytica]GAN80919.1 aldehyde dehydrogenase [Acidocella aminolytica 101 = DSM 11237]GBQ35420.1 NAD-dependent aldehyde dehydrogenase [Acidocella aminolytica 101 = DSM 11237]SHF40752.1 Acyl-CoA reductase [Acidocella aminolytica 101 = DSM 11237]